MRVISGNDVNEKKNKARHELSSSKTTTTALKRYTKFNNFIRLANSSMSKSILFVFSDYPPKSGPGSNRNFYLKQHFNLLGWQSKVLTMSINDAKSDSSLQDDQDVLRAFSRDVTDVLSIAGKYPRIIETPDRWYLWVLPALKKALKQAKKTPFDYIYAGFPSYSGTIVSILLSKILKKPLIFDLRDPFRFRYDPHNMPVHWLYRYIEKKAIAQTSVLVTTTQACAQYYQELYPDFNKDNIHVIRNGFAQEFHRTLPSQAKRNLKQPFIMLHSGILYEIGRNPSTLLNAIKQLVDKKLINAASFKLRFRGANVWPSLVQQIKDLELTDYIEFKSRVSYIEAIKEMQQVDVNVLIQNSLFNLQIPSKLYDILALKSPVIAVTDKSGALAKEMSDLDTPYFAESVDKTAELILQVMENRQPSLSDNELLRRNRYTMNQKLSQILSSKLINNEK